MMTYRFSLLVASLALLSGPSKTADMPCASYQSIVAMLASDDILINGNGEKLRETVNWARAVEGKKPFSREQWAREQGWVRP